MQCFVETTILCRMVVEKSTTKILEEVDDSEIKSGGWSRVSGEKKGGRWSMLLQCLSHSRPCAIQ